MLQKYSFRKIARLSVNKLLQKVGLRIISSSWGPRGFLNTLYRVKRHGIKLNQIIDIGASDGRWTRDCLRVFPDAEYFLVDPLDENSDFLHELQQTKSQVKVWHGALGSRPGQLDLYVHGDQSSFFASEYSQSNRTSIRTVGVRTLDSFLEDRTVQQPDMIKADVQGFEIEVLKGAEKCLENTELLLLELLYRKLYENCPLAHEVISYAGSKGFRIFDICTYVKRPLDGELACSDILFAKADSKLFEFEGWELH